VKWTKEKVERYREMYMSGATYQQLAFEFGISHSAVSEVRKRYKIKPRSSFGKKPAPDDLAAVVDRIGVAAARDHYSVGWETLRRWISTVGLTIDKTKRFKALAERPLIIPKDWAERAPTMFKNQLASHYQISGKAVNRLIEVTGIHSKRIEAKPKPEPKPKMPRRNWRQHSWGQFSSGTQSVEMHTMATEAARFLRRVYPNVHRCDIQMREGSSTTWGDERGMPNRGKGYYLVGSRTMSELEMINHALDRGMNG
jgi:hypothetical protein